MQAEDKPRPSLVRAAIALARVITLGSLIAAGLALAPMTSETTYAWGCHPDIAARTGDNRWVDGCSAQEKAKFQASANEKARAEVAANEKAKAEAEAKAKAEV